MREGERTDHQGEKKSVWKGGVLLAGACRELVGEEICRGSLLLIRIESVCQGR